MTVSYIEYELVEGYIHNWLVAGPHALPVSELERFRGEDRELKIIRHYHDPGPGISEPPVDQADFRIGKDQLSWCYYRCPLDHMVDIPAPGRVWRYLRAWVYTELRLPSSQTISFTLSTYGPADVWIGGVHVHRQEHSQDHAPRAVSFQAELREGDNPLLVRLERAAAWDRPLGMSLRINDLSAEAMAAIAVRVPTMASWPERQKTFEHIFDHAYVRKNVVFMGNDINLRWADDLDYRWRVTYQVQDGRRHIYIDGTTETQPGVGINVGHPARLWERPYYVVVHALPREYYEQEMRYERRMPVHVLDTEYAENPYGSYEERRKEALENAAKRESDLFAEIAKFALGRWEQVDANTIMEAVSRIREHEDGSELELLALLGAIYRYGADSHFPQHLKRPIEECARRFRYWHHEPGDDALRFTTESQSIIFHAAEVLAGQLYPDFLFANREPGQWHWEKGEQRALAWLRQRARSGFSEWDSNDTFARILVALVHLADWAENVEVSELSAILADKLLFSIALNSHRGSFGSTHGCTSTAMILGNQLEATSGISRLLWGMGVWNHHTAGVVSLASSEYELPSLIANVATEFPEELWNRERHLFEPVEELRGSPPREVNKVTYRTPDYMLCSAQDYRPGEMGYEEHIWQATLGPDAVVFVNHPACMSDRDAYRPSFWRGNRVLPRVAQWKDVLIAVHRLPDDDPLGFTHAYFPIGAFDDHALRDGWAFAQYKKGYLALTAAQGIELIKRGPTAYAELRSYGKHNVWLCQMGRAPVDGSFHEFQRKVLAMGVNWRELGVLYTNLRGERISFGWTDPLVVEGKEEPITGFKHYENPYCVVELGSPQMEIRWDDQLLRLDFS